MNVFDTILLLAAKIGFALLAGVVLARWILAPYLWFKYDRPIQILHKEFDDFRREVLEGASGRGIVASVIDGQIASKERQIMEKVENLELKRRHFLDRANLFLTVSSLGK